MQSFSDDEVRQVFGEAFFDTQKAILEYVKDIPQMKKDLQSLNTIEADIRTIKLVIKDSNSQLWNHEKRIKRLELKSQ